MSQRAKKRGRGKRPQRRAARRPKRVAAIATRPGMMRVRRSRVHGRGVFALRRIRKGTRIIEYLGDRVSHRQADRRYEHKDINDNHTFLFIVDRNVVIDGGANGNDARFINHACDPNCESVIEDRRVFIEAIRTIRPGEELTYDYQIGRDRTDPPNVDAIYACRCGAQRCRGTMLWPPKRGLSARRPTTPHARGRGTQAGKRA
ncbi:MAG: SET domain-containing protein [Steroidobacterales bacterium]